jgi:hypothetical protein
MRGDIGRGTLGLAMSIFALALGGAAAEALPDEKLFDPPDAFQDLPAIEGAHPAEALRCGWYADFMIRQTRTDSPAMGPSYVVRASPSGTRPVCRAAATPRDTRLELDSETLLGRKGDYLIYEATDANGAEPFIVLHLPDGRQIYGDEKNDFPNAASKPGFQIVELQGQTLHLRYSRGYNASCSILKDGVACWNKAMKEGHFARAVASQPVPIESCATSYKVDNQTPSTDTSMIVYDVDMTLTAAGKATVLSRGPITCLPAP